MLHRDLGAFGHFHKLARAKEHLDTLHAEVNAFFEPRPYRVSPEGDAKTGEYVLRVKEVTPIPVRFSVLIGDVIHNLRSCLDHLSWELNHSPRARGLGTPRGNMDFPVFTNRSQFYRQDSVGGWHPRGGKAKILGLAPDVQAIIERLQPCNGTNWPPDEHPLAVLSALDVRDKHQALNLVAFQFRPGSVSVDETDNAVIMDCVWEKRPMEVDAIVAHIRTRPANPTKPGKVNLRYEVAPTVAFGKPGPASGQIVIPKLIHIHDYIELAVIPPLAPYL